MQEYLYEQLRAIDDIPDYVEVDRPKEFGEVFAEWKERSGLVKRAIDGELTLTQDFEELKEKLGWIKDLYPHTIDEELTERVRSYEEISGMDLLQEDSLNLLVNPTTLGVGMGTIGLGASSLINPLTRRRKFLLGSLWGLAGIFSWTFVPFVKNKQYNDISSNISYIQKKIDEYAPVLR